jgi:hypothetical protein
LAAYIVAKEAIVGKGSTRFNNVFKAALEAARKFENNLTMKPDVIKYC